MQNIKDIVLVTSVISSLQRTFFSPEQRLEQTILTAKSVRERFPSAFLVLIESPRISDLWRTLLGKHYDLVLVVPPGEDSTNISNISQGEVSLLTYGIKTIQKMGFSNLERIFKLSGRYTLTEDFDSNAYPVNQYGFGHHILVDTPPAVGRDGWSIHPKWGLCNTVLGAPVDYTCYITVLFSVPAFLATEFLGRLNLSYDIEHALYRNIPSEQVKIVPLLGFEGFFGSDGMYIRR